MNHYVKWHGRMVWLGILVNMIFVFPLFLVPNLFLGLLGIHIDQPIWARSAAMLLFIISVFYIPPTWDLKRYRASAWIAIFPSRTFGATFFTVAVLVFGFPVGFLSIAVVDAFFGLTTLYLLLQVTKAEKAAGEPVSLR